jgi:hypothetical protein
MANTKSSQRLLRRSLTEPNVATPANSTGRYLLIDSKVSPTVGYIARKGCVTVSAPIIAVPYANEGLLFGF